MIVRIKNEIGYDNGTYRNQEKAFASQINARAKDNGGEGGEVAPPTGRTGQRVGEPVTKGEDGKNQNGQHDAKTVGQPRTEINMRQPGIFGQSPGSRKIPGESVATGRGKKQKKWRLCWAKRCSAVRVGRSTLPVLDQHLELIDDRFDLFQVFTARFIGSDLQGPAKCQNVSQVANPSCGNVLVVNMRQNSVPDFGDLALETGCIGIDTATQCLAEEFQLLGSRLHWRSFYDLGHGGG